MHAVLQRAWLRRSALACVLWPLSLLFGALAALRRTAYRLQWSRAERVGVPVIVVGNVVAGGAGKTPVVMALVRHLRSRGLACGVVSRGYGRDTTDCREVTAQSTAREAGDEPLLVKRSCNVPVFVAASRTQAARALLAAYPATQVIVCDDGLQHYALARDVEICVFDERGTGNGWLLPAGPLREPWPRAVDLVVQSGNPSGIAGFHAERRLAGFALRADGTRIAIKELAGRPLAAVAAIARPEVFFGMLRDAGLSVQDTIALPDHDGFDADPAPGKEVVCTEKDAVKLWALRPDAWAVPLEVDIEAGFWSGLDTLLAAKLSSRHGSQTS